MSWVIYIYLTILVLLAVYCVIIIARILPLIIYVRQPLPFVPAPQKLAKAIARLPELAQAKTMIDLGCGTGTLLSIIHHYLPNIQLTGVEYKASLLRWAKWRSYFWKPQPILVCADMFPYPIQEFDAVVGFWIPRFMPKLIEKFVAECKPGCVIASCLFPLPEHSQLQVLPHSSKEKIFVYRKV